MGYFPFFMSIEGRTCLIVGGGRVALHKARKLKGFGPDITVVAPDICRELRDLGVRTVERPFEERDLEGADLCIAAGNKDLDRRISALCLERGIPVNCVDDPEACSFFFPSLVERGDITIGISTSGTAPAFAKYLRERLEELLDGRLLEAAELMKALRPRLGALEERDRPRAARELLEWLLASDEIPNEAAAAAFIERIGHGKT